MTLNGGRLQVGVCVCRGNCLVGLAAGCCTSMLVCMGSREEEGGRGVGRSITTFSVVYQLTSAGLWRVK